MGAVTVGILAVGAGVADAAPGGAKISVAQRLSRAKQQVDQRAVKLNDKASRLQQRINASATLTTVQRALIQGDLTRLVNGMTVAKRQVAAAIDIASLRAARPALQAVRTDRGRLNTDLAAAHAGHHHTGHPTTGHPKTGPKQAGSRIRFV